MGEVYNPEAALIEQLEALTVEARHVRQKRDETPDEADRAVLTRQLQELEQRIGAIQRRLKSQR